MACMRKCSGTPDPCTRGGATSCHAQQRQRGPPPTTPRSWLSTQRPAATAPGLCGHASLGRAVERAAATARACARAHGEARARSGRADSATAGETAGTCQASLPDAPASRLPATHPVPCEPLPATRPVPMRLKLGHPAAPRCCPPLLPATHRAGSRNSRAQTIFHAMFGEILRSHEQQAHCGTFYYLWGATQLGGNDGLGLSRLARSAPPPVPPTDARPPCLMPAAKSC